jgi:hypothetical protein
MRCCFYCGWKGGVERRWRRHSKTKNSSLELFMAGNILFYAIALGKEGFARTWWCNNWC